MTFKYFFTRKLTFIRHSDAIALFPGGFGTMDEAYEALTLMQTGKSQLMPLVLVDRPGGTYWKTWDKNVQEHLLRNQLISPDDLNLYDYTDDVDVAVKLVTRFYRNYHSSRFVRDKFVVRLRNAPTPSGLVGLREDFGDLLESGDFTVSSALDGEEEVLDLPRLVFEFDRKSYGRLRQMIDVLNSF